MVMCIEAIVTTLAQTAGILAFMALVGFICWLAGRNIE